MVDMIVNLVRTRSLYGPGLGSWLWPVSRGSWSDSLILCEDIRLVSVLRTYLRLYSLGDGHHFDCGCLPAPLYMVSEKSPATRAPECAETPDVKNVLRLYPDAVALRRFSVHMCTRHYIAGLAYIVAAFHESACRSYYYLRVTHAIVSTHSTIGIMCSYNRRLF